MWNAGDKLSTLSDFSRDVAVEHPMLKHSVIFSESEVVSPDAGGRLDGPTVWGAGDFRFRVRGMGAVSTKR